MSEEKDTGYLRKTCRLCGALLGSSRWVMALTSTPPANALQDAPGHAQAHPLDLYLCNLCGHLQLGYVIDPKSVYKDYKYVSPPGMRPHWKKYAETAVEKLDLKPGARVVEIGSNNGDLLREFQKRGCKVLGFEPAARIAEEAENGGVPTLACFFNEDTSKLATMALGGEVDLICANNVFAHIDDLDAVVRAVGKALTAKGVLVFEVQYRLAMVKNGLFDMIYHEHLDYHAVKPLVSFLSRHNLTVFDVEHVSTHGGSIRVYARRWNVDDEATTSDRSNVIKAILDEENFGLYRPETYSEWSKTIELMDKAFGDLIEGMRWARLNGGDNEPSFVGYGVPAKATTLLWQFGLTDLFDYVVDDSTWKQGRYMPGTELRIEPGESIFIEPPDYVVILAWNFADAIVEKVKASFLAKGMKPPRCIIPLPKLRIV